MKVFRSSILLATTCVSFGGAFITSPTSFIPRSSDSPLTSSVAVSISSCTTKTRGFSSALQLAFESPEEVEMDAEERMEKSIGSIKKNLQTIRTGRANAAILDLVQVDYYGAPTPLNQLASISVPNSQQLSVDPYDKSALGDIEKSIIESGLGLTPNNDGSLIRINIPPITEDRRKELLKKCKAIGEDGKVAIRNVRRDSVDSVKKMEKASEIGEDESKGSQSDIQKITDKYIKEVDSIVSGKEKEVMTV